jgi:hypothetical protein
MDEIHRLLGPSRQVERLLAESQRAGEPAACYLFSEAPPLGSLSRALLLVPPAEAELSEQAEFEKQARAWIERLGQEVKVGCFSLAAVHAGSSPSYFQCLSPEALWEELTGVQASPHSSEPGMGAHDEFVERSLLVGSDPTAREAVRFLRRWVDGYESRDADGVLITGERGAGKTWLLRRLEVELLSQHWQSPWLHPAPVFVQLSRLGDYLRGHRGSHRTLMHFLLEAPQEGWLRWRRTDRPPDTRFLEALATSGRLLLLLDGVDELANEATESSFERLVDDLLTGLPPAVRFVMTSRASKVPFLIERLIRHGSLLSRALKTGEANTEYLPQNEVSASDFNLLHATLVPFEEKDLERLYANLRTDEQQSPDPAALELLTQPAAEEDKLTRAGKQALRELCGIPAAARSVLERLATGEGPRDVVQLFEHALFQVLISYNLEVGRAYDQHRYRLAGGEETSFKVQSFGLALRVQLLEGLAHSLLEHEAFVEEGGTPSTTPEILDDLFAEMIGPPYATLAPDLVSQTVLRRVVEPSHLISFRSDAIRGYFSARYLFRRLVSENEMRALLRDLDHADLTRDLHGQVCLFFLADFLKRGMLDFRESDRLFLGHDRQPRLSPPADLEKRLTAGEASLVATRRLRGNLEALGLSTREVLVLSEPARIVESGEARITFSEVFIPTSGDLDPFFLANHEVTNWDFARFLRSKLRPGLAKPGFLKGRQLAFWKEGELPELFAPETAADSSGGLRRHLLTSHYLLHWVDGEIPRGREYHPVIWVNQYVAAAYCNWLTTIRFGPEHVYYRLRIDGGHRPQLSVAKQQESGGWGYRLPDSAEWRAAAAAGESLKSEPWEHLTSSKDPKIRDRGERFRVLLTRRTLDTQDVRRFRANAYGIYAIIGNVREWTYRVSSDQYVMGSTPYVLRSFQFGYEGEIEVASKARLDVGFRVARSLTPEERQQIPEKPVAPDAGLINRAVGWTIEAGRNLVRRGGEE